MQPFRMDRGLLNRFIIFFLLLLTVLFVLLRFDFTLEKEIKISGTQGELPLAFWYPEVSAPLPLDEGWLGFPDQLLPPEEVVQNLNRSVLVSFPDVWQPPKPRRHVMTYTLMLKRIPQGVSLGLKLPELKNSFRLFVDQQEVAAGGFASDRLDQHKAYFGDRIVRLGTLPDQARLTLQVSNYGHSRGGVHEAPVLASEAHWLDYYRFNILVECVVITLALIAGVLIFLEFYLVPEHKELLWIALFSLVLAGYIGSSGLGGLATLIPSFPWQLAVRMEYIGFVAAIPLFLNWLVALYHKDLQCRGIRWLSRIAFGLTLFILLTPSALFTDILYPALVFLCISMGFGAWAITRLVLLNRSGVGILVVGSFALMAGIVHDLLIFLDLMQGRNLLGIGVLVFLVSQLGFLTFYRTQEQLRILDLNKSLNSAVRALDNRIRWNKDELESRRRQLEQRKELTAGLLQRDALTGLLNRQHFLKLIERRQARAPGLNCSFIIVDIDHYKVLVEEYGREFAEGVLVEFANFLKEWCTGYFDRIPARYGGDEFIIWLGHCSYDQAEALAREIRKNAAMIRVPVKMHSEPSSTCRFAVSTGVASGGLGRSASLSSLLARAADAVHLNRHQWRQSDSEGSKGL